jgi:hypothetical protein
MAGKSQLEEKFGRNVLHNKNDTATRRQRTLGLHIDIINDYFLFTVPGGEGAKTPGKD